MKTKLSDKLSFLIALFIVGLFVLFIIILYPEKENFQLLEIFEFRTAILKGFGLTLLISITALVFSIIFGFILYLLSVAHNKILKYLSMIYTDIIFGSPLLVFIITITYLVVFPVFRFTGYYVGDILRILIGTLALSLYMAPYMKSVFEGAMESIDENQYQAMKVFGFSKYQQYRYIIIPQLMRIIIPPLVANFTVIVKSSSLLSFITIPELYNSITNIAARNFLQLEGYLVLFLLYLCITIPLIRITKYFEKRVALWS